MKSVFLLLLLSAAVFVANSPASDVDEVPMRVAKAYGADQWDQVEELRYTFNVKSGDRETRRAWIWRVKERTVTFHDEIAGGEPFTYSLDAVGDDPPEELKNVDHRFINDQYWLLFALHVAWDEGTEVSAAADQPLPIGEGTATRVTVQYGAEGGYTPGDAYDLYVDESDTVLQWVFRQGGQEEPSLACTWEAQEKFGPLTVPTKFAWSDGEVKLWFSGIEVMTAE